jgi:hypothetical protein
MTMGKELSPSLPGPASRTTRLPLLVDICLNVSQIIVLIVAVITAILSILANVDALTVILRTAVAIIGVGLPLYTLNYLLGRYYIQATLDEMETTLEESITSESKEDGSLGELEAEA